MKIKEILLVIIIILIFCSPVIIVGYISIRDYIKCSKLNGYYMRDYCIKKDYFIDTNKEVK